MQIETCAFMHDRYVFVNNVPSESWEDIIKSNFHTAIEEMLDKPILSYNITVHFCPRREIPISYDRRKVLGYYDFMGNNTCMIYVYDKINPKNMYLLTYEMVLRMKKDFTDTTLHYNHEGNPCHCERGKEYAI